MPLFQEALVLTAHYSHVAEVLSITTHLQRNAKTSTHDSFENPGTRELCCKVLRSRACNTALRTTLDC
eukprot:9113-Heterococcus_DN1.PRE.3